MNMGGRMTVLVPAIVLTAIRRNLALRTVDGSALGCEETPRTRGKARRSAPIILVQVPREGSALDTHNRIMAFLNFLRANDVGCNIKVFHGFECTGGDEKAF